MQAHKVLKAQIVARWVEEIEKTYEEGVIMIAKCDHVIAAWKMS